MTDRIYRFADFELDVSQGALRVGQSSIPLQQKPLLLLTALLEQPQRVVTREQLRERMWGNGTFVDYEQGINVAIKKVRSALGDSAENPRFIETVAKRGYRFLLPVEKTGGDPAAAQVSHSKPLAVAKVWPRRQLVGLAIASLALVSLALLAGAFRQHAPQRAFAHGKATLMVVPLDNLSGDTEQEYFSDGITEEITTQLARLDPNHLAVIGRLTATRYKHSGKDIAQIGKEVPVDYVLEGSVRREQTRIRATLQLIEVASQTHVWANEYDRDLGDALSLQREIATAVAGEIKLKLGAEQEHRLASGSAASAEAHDAYLRGRYEWNKRTEPGFRAAIKYFEAALQIQPDYAPAYAGLADTYNLLGQYGYSRPDDAYPKAKSYASKALQLDNTLAEAHTALADVETKYDLNWQQARSEFLEAIDANPNYATAHLWYAEDYLTHLGETKEAIIEVKKAQEIEPLSPIIGSIVAETFYFARDYDHAIEEAKKVLEIEPNFLPAIERLGWAYEQKGMLPEAISEFQRACDLSDGSDEMRTQLAHAYAVSGNRPEARRILSDLLQKARAHYVSPYFFAVIYTALGQKAVALTWLDKTYQEHDVPPVIVEPRFDPLRAEPAYAAMVRKLSTSLHTL
jgi:TolB-like protein/DNA-binding winged helix-turn-helix (wHTH) protein/Tfp pilus assembly protein PilF